MSDNEDYQRGYRDGLKRAAEIADEYSIALGMLHKAGGGAYQEGASDGAEELGRAIRREMGKGKADGK